MIQSQPSGLKDFVRLRASSNELVSQLGPLADLIGSWHGNQGWNLVAVPQGEKGFRLLIQPFSETITFTPVGAPVPNRGGTTEQFVMALTYELTIVDIRTQGVLHIENGMWLNLADIEDQAPPSATPFSIARQACVPHGDVVIALGTATASLGTPDIEAINTIPDIGQPTFQGYTDPYFHNDFPQFDTRNPNAMLVAALTGQQIGKVMTFQLDTAGNGSISNIPFLDQHVKPSAFQCTFWIEDVLNPDGSTAFQQLQYSQQTNLNFLPKFNEPGTIMWPHVNVNTLVKR